MSERPYRRSGITFTGFALIGTWAYFLYLLGPASGAIGEDLGLSDAQEGFIATPLAVGLLGAAWLGPWAVRRWGRVGSLLRILIGMVVFAVALIVSQTYLMVLLCVFLLGLIGAVLANTTTAVLAEHHPGHEARTITEANAAAAWLGVVAPVALGFFINSTLGWRGAVLILAIAPLFVIGPVLRMHRVAPAHQATVKTKAQPMPRVFWVALVVVAMAVATEFSINFWAANVIQAGTDASPAAAAAALSASVAGVAIGRTFFAGLGNRFELTRLLIAFFLLTAVGVVLFLLAPTYVTAVVALLICGVGLSILFPYAQAKALEIAGEQADRAVGLVGLAIGVAIGLAPFLLGVLAGSLGLLPAFSSVFLLIAAGVAATFRIAARSRAT